MHLETLQLAIAEYRKRCAAASTAETQEADAEVRKEFMADVADAMREAFFDNQDFQQAVFKRAAAAVEDLTTREYQGTPLVGLRLPAFANPDTDLILWVGASRTYLGDTWASAAEPWITEAERDAATR